MEHEHGYGIRISRTAGGIVTLQLTHDNEDTETYFEYLTFDVTLNDLINTIRSWYMFGALNRIEDRDRLIAETRKLWPMN